jgi:hypothetical protein
VNIAENLHYRSRPLNPRSTDMNLPQLCKEARRVATRIEVLKLGVLVFSFIDESSLIVDNINKTAEVM